MTVDALIEELEDYRRVYGGDDLLVLRKLDGDFEARELLIEPVVRNSSQGSTRACRLKKL
jgi:hypothetical protein